MGCFAPAATFPPHASWPPTATAFSRGSRRGNPSSGGRPTHAWSSSLPNSGFHAPCARPCAMATTRSASTAHLPKSSRPARTRRAPGNPAPGSPPRCAAPMGNCMNLAGRIRSKHGVAASSSAVSTVWLSAGCSMENRCFHCKRTRRRSPWPTSSVFLRVVISAW